jgi:hypothetical protein
MRKTEKFLIAPTGNGFTLVEVMIYIFIASFVFTGFLAFFFLISEIRVRNQSREEIISSVQYALPFIRKQILGADDIISPLEGTTSQVVLIKDTLEKRIILDRNILVFIDEGAEYPITSPGAAIADFQVKREGADLFKITLDFENGPEVSPVWHYAETFETSIKKR